MKTILWGFVICALLLTGVVGFHTYYKYDNKTRFQKDEIIITEFYGGLAYLEITIKNGLITKVSRKSSLENHSLTYEVDYFGRVRRIIDIVPSIFGETKVKIASREKDKTISWEGADYSARTYIECFRDKHNLYQYQ